MWPASFPKRRHIISFAIFFIAIFATLYIVAQKSEPYEAAEAFLIKNIRIEQVIGPVHEVKLKFWDGFEFSSTSLEGDANFTFNVTGVKDVLVVQVFLRKREGAWHIVRANAREIGSVAEFDVEPGG